MGHHTFFLLLLALLVLPVLAACGETVPTDPEEDLELFDGGYFTLLKPAGWEVSTAGMCSDIHIQTWDPDNPIRRVLHAGLIGPFFEDPQLKQLMLYNRMPLSASPVLFPVSGANVLVQMQQIAMQPTSLKTENFPYLQNIRVYSSQPSQPAFGIGTGESLFIGFEEQGQEGSGYFHASFIATGGLVYVKPLRGYTAEAAAFGAMQPLLAQSLASIRFTDAYNNQCLRMQQSVGQVTGPGTGQEIGDMQWEAWMERSRAQDVMHEKMTDAIMGRERLYDPETGRVWDAPTGFYEDIYDPDRHGFDMNNLQPLPPYGGYDAWMRPTTPVEQGLE